MMALTDTDRRRFLLATTLTLLALPALWWANQSENSTAPNVAVAGAGAGVDVGAVHGDTAASSSDSAGNVSHATRAHGDGDSEAVGAIAPVFLDGPSSAAGAGLSEIAVPARPDDRQDRRRCHVPQRHRRPRRLRRARHHQRPAGHRRQSRQRAIGRLHHDADDAAWPATWSRCTVRCSPNSPISPTRRSPSRSIGDAFPSRRSANCSTRASLAPRRDLGQNFVADPNTVRRIADLARVGAGRPRRRDRRRARLAHAGARRVRRRR